MSKPTTLGQLKATNYTPRSVKAELRDNLIQKLKADEPVFSGILGFEDTVLPDVERAILSQHNILLLGLRGQAKTRIARLLVHLLDEEIPVVAGSEIMDDPLQPISRYAHDLIADLGEDTPIEWVGRDARYVEKLATPDVSVADLVGDVDPIKAASLKLPYSDERVIHFGLIPRAHRGIFVINELPDLQPRIQVALFNILQEGDMQIRGFALRLPLDIQFLFTANPEDYTNRGSIITPLKDRIESQILTHYPKTVHIARTITLQEVCLPDEQRTNIEVPDVLHTLLEQISFEARESAFVDEKSGVSARLSISGYENLLSTAERRMLLNGESKTQVRILDFMGVVPAITGKVELVYEGEQEGAYGVAMSLLGEAIKSIFLTYFPDPEMLTRKGQQSTDPYGIIRMWFAGGNRLEQLTDDSDQAYRQALDQVAGLRALAEKYTDATGDALYPYMELAIHGLSTYNIISKDLLEGQVSFGDLLGDLLDEDLYEN